MGLCDGLEHRSESVVAVIYADAAIPSTAVTSERRAPQLDIYRSIDLSDTERNEQWRLQFLRTVYDPANDTQSRRVRGVDIAERLGLNLNGEEFHDLARYQVIAGNIEAIETNWGRLALTARGKAEVERHAPPR
jgi:hypothetical protein